MGYISGLEFTEDERFVHGWMLGQKVWSSQLGSVMRHL